LGFVHVQGFDGLATLLQMMRPRFGFPHQLQIVPINANIHAFGHLRALLNLADVLSAPA